jgi:hypothetical protein
MKKVVEVFVRDRLVAAYPILREELGGLPPNDGAFIGFVKERMKRPAYSARDVEAARFLVRSAWE